MNTNHNSPSIVCLLLHNNLILCFLLFVQTTIKCMCNKDRAAHCITDTQTETCKLRQLGARVTFAPESGCKCCSKSDAELCKCLKSNKGAYTRMHKYTVFSLHISFMIQLCDLRVIEQPTDQEIGECTACSQGFQSCYLILKRLGLNCLTNQMEEKPCYWVTCMDIISGLDCNESSPLPSELGHQWSSGQPQLSELQRGCQSRQSHILRRQAAQLGQ